MLLYLVEPHLVVDIGEKDALFSVLGLLQRVVPVFRLHQAILHIPIIPEKYIYINSRIIFESYKDRLNSVTNQA